MSLSSDCEASIFSFAPQIRQNNAAISGEHSDYVGIVLILLRENYQKLKSDGETEWSIPANVAETLNSMKPY